MPRPNTWHDHSLGDRRHNAEPRQIDGAACPAAATEYSEVGDAVVRYGARPRSLPHPDRRFGCLPRAAQMRFADFDGSGCTDARLKDVVMDYPHPAAMVWHAVTDPELVARWTVTGQGGRPVGFTPIVGSKFQLVAKPVPGWRGVVDCEVLEVDAPRLLRYSWRGEEDGKPTMVSYRIEPRVNGTRFMFDHTGFTGLGGFFMAKLLGAVRRKMLNVGLPAVLNELAKGAPGAVADGRTDEAND